MSKNSVSYEISQAIKENKWLDIIYDSAKEKRETQYWISIRDIVPKGKKLIVDIFNSSKSLESLTDIPISFERIKSARRIDFTCGDDNSALIEKLEANPLAFGFLHFQSFDNNILSYLMECARLSADPFQKNYQMVEGIDLNLLLEKKKVLLNESQMRDIIKCIYFNDLKRIDLVSNELAISDFSLDIGGKKYVVAYYSVYFNPTDKTISIRDKIKINRSFLIEKRPHSLDRYIDMNADDFEKEYPSHKAELQNLIKENCNRGEQINTRPDLMILEREMPVNLAPLFEKVAREREEGTLEVPMKAFFGDISRRNNLRRKEPKIVVYDKRINIDQIRVLYNALKQPVTYVQGPPGTGKTQTLFNVIVSAYFNEKTVLVCTNNNRPVDGIIEKISFQYKGREIPFPFLRLGNQEFVKQATLKIRDLINNPFPGEVNWEKIRAIMKRESEKNAELSEFLRVYEDKLALRENIECAKAIFNKCERHASQLEEEIRHMQERYDSMRSVTNAEVLKLFSCASESPEYQSYLYFSSLAHIRLLQMPRYAKLREICFIEDDDERVSSFNSWCRNPENGDENMKLLSDVFPIIFSTNISANNLGNGEFKFDLVLMDEAGQCEIAHSLIPLARAKSLLLVGDVDQLQPVIVMDPDVNKELMAKYKISDTYNYCENSIIRVMQNADNISKRILLRYHYRSGKKIIGFSNKYFYGGKLKLDFAPGEGDISMKAVKSQRCPYRNASIEEALEVVDYLKKNDVENTVIITPFNNQKYLIDDMIERAGIKGVTACTVHSMQGGEANTVILSSAITQQTSPRTYEWLKKCSEIANVAVTRAQKKLVFIGDPDSIEKLSTGDDVWNSLMKYARSNGKVEVIPPKTKTLEIGLSHGSKAEDEFYKTMAQLCSVEKNFTVKRNVKVKDLFSDDPLLSQSKMEFDSVIYHKKSLFRKETPFIAFEINGGEHVGDAKRTAADARKRELCKQKNLKLITIGNSDVKNYECMREMIRKMNNQEYEQMLLDLGEK